MNMTLSKYEIGQLTRVITYLQKIVLAHAKNGTTDRQSPRRSRRVRRSGKELVAFRKMLVAERKKGVSVTTLAKRHGISTAYIYQL
jgi:DNA-directed RNA polymerase specialized sigma subunit